MNEHTKYQSLLTYADGEQHVHYWQVEVDTILYMVGPLPRGAVLTIEQVLS